MTLQTAKTVTLEHRGDVSTVTLNRPDALNAIDVGTHHLLQDLLKQADDEPSTRVIVLRGAGKAFSAGGDVKGMLGKTYYGNDDRPEVHAPGVGLINTLVGLQKPIIAQVHGVAVGLGATIALFCDIVVLADTASIGDRHVNVGLVAGDGGAVIWPLLIGPSRAKLYLMTGRMIPAIEAERMGLITLAVPEADLETTVADLASELAGLPPYAVRATKLSVNKTIEAATSLILETSLAYEHLSMRMDDHQEAVRAFLERRPGNYTGR